MKIFIDIGSHVGETLVEAAKEKYAFDKIVCFEPSMFCMDDLKKFSDKTGIELEVVVRKIAFDIYRGITEKTPVLTGRAKGNWNIGLGRINNSINESATSTPKGSAGKLKIPLKGAGLKSIYITNNLPYIYTLEYGLHIQF